MDLPQLHNGRILKRYKRFLADIDLDDGRRIIAHCPNTGSMTTCWTPGATVQVSHSNKPTRKLAWTLERVDMGRGWIGVHTGRVNGVIAEAIGSGRIPSLAGYRRITAEPQFVVDGFPRSRFDLHLTDGQRRDTYVEVKNTTLLDGDCIRFPDSVTERGRKHLELLREAVRRGLRGVIVFAVNRPEGRAFEPAWDIDPNYSGTLHTVAQQGVEVLAARLRHTHSGIEVAGSSSLTMTRISWA
jgi:sugar fermentation stimulation protein A